MLYFVSIDGTSGLANKLTNATNALTGIMAYALTMLPPDITGLINNIAQDLLKEEHKKQIKKQLAEDVLELVAHRLNQRVCVLNSLIMTRWEDKHIAIYNDELGRHNHQDFDYYLPSPAEADWEYLKSVYFFNGFVHRNMHLQDLLHDQERYLFTMREP